MVRLCVSSKVKDAVFGHDTLSTISAVQGDSMTRLVVLLVLLGISPIELQGPGAMEPQPSSLAARPVAGSGILPRLFLPFTPIAPIQRTISHFSTLNVGSALPSDAQCAA